MASNAEWSRGYARQAGADYFAWNYLQNHPELNFARCHKLQFLQMACEKLCKAYLCNTGMQPAAVQSSHAFTAKNLPVLIRAHLGRLKEKNSVVESLLKLTRQIGREIELLAPSVDNAGKRPDNCEAAYSRTMEFLC